MRNMIQPLLHFSLFPDAYFINPIAINRLELKNIKTTNIDWNIIKIFTSLPLGN